MSQIPNLWHLQVLKAVIETGSVTAAAAALRLTQPAASQALQNLAAHYGAALTIRAHGGVEASEAGALLLRRAETALDLLSGGLKEAASGASFDALAALRAMSAHRLDALIGVVRHGSFALAARASGLAAPTIHRAARELEKRLNVALFEQTSYGVKPTRRAEMLATKASLAFAELDQARAEIDALRGEEAGRTVIGAMPLARSHLAPAVAAAFSAHHPGHRISIFEGAYEDMLTGLRRGEIDILVGALRENLPAKDVVQEPLFTDALSIVMRAGHPAASAKRVTKAILQRYPWIAPRLMSPLRRHFEDLFEKSGLEAPEDIIECNSLGASRVLLMNSDRLMLLSDAQIRYEKAAGMLVSRPHPHGAVLRDIGLTTRAGWRPTQTQAALVALLKQQSKALAA